ncbi:MAG: MFS transporter [Actinomycetota bacterium]|nr:MFS transporter [Actinomycetota bacterium]
MRSRLIGLAIGLALADSSIVTLALPDVLREFDVDVTTVAWVLTSFNLVLALAALPAALAARRRPRATFVAGTLVFAASSLACGLAPSFEVLVGARGAQAVGAALLVTAALGLLAETTGSGDRAVRVWVAAGVFGAALGPAAGGIITEVLGWESIFLVQVPLALLPLAALRGLRSSTLTTMRSGRPQLTANAALLLLSGGLVAALFLLVLLLVEGWGLSPAAAGLVVTAMPVAALATARFAKTGTLGMRAASGAILVAGGLAGLALLPRAGWAWTIAPQLLVGAGIGLALAALTERAIAGRDRVVHGGWTLAARHAGVVLGLLLLTPVLTAALDRNEDEAVRAGAAEVLDSRISALDKVRLAQDVLDEMRAAEQDGRLPEVEAAFEDRPDDEEHRALRSALRDQLERAITNAFSGPFLLAAALALAALVPVALARGVPP